MSAREISGASPIKSGRRTRADINSLRDGLLRIVLAGDGMTVRHLFYRAVAAGLIEKSEAEYENVVVRLAKEMRRERLIPFGKIVDGSRLYVVPETYNGVADAISDTARIYRRSYWRSAGIALEIWSEKDAIRALIEDTAADLAVPLMVTRGFASESVVQSLAEATLRSGKPRIILGLNDFDPSGQLMMQDVLRRAKHYAPRASLSFQQVALTEQQVARYRLPTRPTKRDGNNHARGFGSDVSVELDALEPDDLRDLLRRAIEEYVDPVALTAMEAAEDSERTTLLALAREMAR